ncbi:MAG: hypothetical protein HYY36_03510 [Gammaproteobacteria bacterium]|nr:hypothetical protein [Gammaproteobacteria bacterium]
MPEKTLRDLAREYAKGTLGKDAYRKSRAALLEGILSGDVAVPVHEFATPAVPRYRGETPPITERRTRRPQAAGSETERDDATAVMIEPARSPAPAQPALPARTGTIVAAVVIVALIVVAVVAGRSGNSPETAPAASAPGAAPPPTQVVPQATDAASVQLIREFLQEKNWSEASMDEFLSGWRTLSPEQRASAASSLEMGQLANTIYKKLLEERALSGLGDGEEALAKQQGLISFAGEIGIEDPRLTLPDQP